MGNKKLLWILGVVILVVLSVSVMALANPFAGLGTRVSGAFGNYGGGIGILIILVNAVIIAFILYLIVTKFKIVPLESKSGKAALFIGLVLFSFYISSNISKGAGGTYHFIWTKAVVGELLFYFFNGDSAKGAIGILRPSRILIFAGATLLLSWLFVGYLKIGGEGSYKKVDYALAALIAAEATRAGISKGMVIFLGQVIAMFMLYTQFNKTEGRKKFVSFVWAYALQSVIVRALFSPNDMIPFSGILTAVAFPKSVTGGIWFVLGLVLIVPALYGLASVFGWIGGKEKAAGYGTMKNIKDYIKRPFLNWANRTNWIGLRWLFAKLDVHDITPGGTEKTEWAWPVREMWVELMTQMNYLLRLEVYRAKGYSVDIERNAILAAYSKDTTIPNEDGKEIKHYDKSLINWKLDTMANGTGFEMINHNKDFEIEPNGKSINNEYQYFDNKGRFIYDARVEAMYGEDSSHFLILEFFKNVGMLLEKSMTHIEQGTADIDKYIDGVVNDLKKNLKTMSKNLNAAAVRLKGHKKRRGSWNIVHNSRLWFLDQYGLFGEYKHVYKYARPGGRGSSKWEESVAPGAQIYKVPYTTDTNKNPPFHTIKPEDILHMTQAQRDSYKWGGDVNYPGGRIAKDLVEVDHEGYFQEDWNNIKMTGSGILRRVMPYEKLELQNTIINGVKKKIWIPNIIYDLKHSTSMIQLSTEWNFWNQDITEGVCHPSSRTALDYTTIHARPFRRKYKNSITQKHGAPKPGLPAFDRKALLDPGRFIYWGKKDRDHKSWQDINIGLANPFPAITTQGLSNYISDYIGNFADELGREQRKRFVWGTSKKEIFTGNPKDQGGNQ